MKKWTVSVIRPKLESTNLLKKKWNHSESGPRSDVKITKFRFINTGWDKRRSDRINRVLKELETLWGNDPLVWDTRKGRGMKLRNTKCLRNIKKLNFSYKSVETLTGLEKGIQEAKNKYEFKA